MMSSFATVTPFTIITIVMTFFFVAIFVGVLVYISVHRKSSFDKQRELPFHDEK